MHSCLIVWLALCKLAIHGFSALRNRHHMSLIAYALVLVRYHKQTALQRRSTEYLFGITVYVTKSRQKQLANSVRSQTHVMTIV